jgi:hypothetical protein
MPATTRVTIVVTERSENAAKVSVHESIVVRMRENIVIEVNWLLVAGEGVMFLHAVRLHHTRLTKLSRHILEVIWHLHRRLTLRHVSHVLHRWTRWPMGMARRRVWVVESGRERL